MSDSDSWKIPASAEQCARCEVALHIGDEVTVLLCLGEDGPAREDLCARCGEAVDASGTDVFWRHRLPESAVASPVVDYALLREMFHRMLARAEPVYQRLSYLVGLVLVRKRHLRLKGFERRNGTEVMVVSRGAGEPDLDVPAPHLSAEVLVQTRELLTRLLAADLPSEDLEHGPVVESQDGAHGEPSGDDDPMADGSAQPAAEAETSDEAETDQPPTEELQHPQTAAAVSEAPITKNRPVRRRKGPGKRTEAVTDAALIIEDSRDASSPGPELN